MNGFTTKFLDIVVKGDGGEKIHNNLVSNFVDFRLILNFPMREKLCKCTMGCVTLLQPQTSVFSKYLLAGWVIRV